MKNLLKIGLGIVTSIGGFLDAGTIATAALAGAAFGFQLLWVVILGTGCVILLTEMCGRLAAVSHHSLSDAIRERLGFRYFAVPLVGEVLVDLLVLAAEIGGVAIAVHLVTGITYLWFVPICALGLWALLWLGTFSAIENGVSLAGMVTLSFVVAAFGMDPPWREIARGAVPSLPSRDAAQYWFLAVGIIGALITPYVLNFYATGAIEEKWTVKDIAVNRVIAATGMSFGSIVAMSMLVLAALVLGTRGIQVDSYEQAALVLTQPFGRWGLYLFAASLGVACLGAALQVSLNLAYVVAQGFGWNWSENLKPHEDARFAAVYTAAILASSTLLFVGDPIGLTTLSMALNAVIAPLVVFPLLVIMNDRAYLRDHRNHVLGNLLVASVVVLAFVVAAVAIPLEVFGG
ncbi:MAG TPA: divalent metal cation transporter [Vicinamibacterales bacterium]|nr:divalent metal cation transporter [Vicinamibacterales bacterium]